jgi:hypothetical protein
MGLGRSETKFAIGSGAKSVCVCFYEPENNWWISKHIKKKHTSSVTDVAWHPNSLLLATASTDCRCRIYSAFVKGVDDPVRPVSSPPPLPRLPLDVRRFRKRGRMQEWRESMLMDDDDRLPEGRACRRRCMRRVVQRMRRLGATVCCTPHTRVAEAQAAGGRVADHRHRRPPH